MMSAESSSAELHGLKTGSSGTTRLGASQSRPHVVIAHDYLTQRGGAERVVLSMCRAFPTAPIVTSIYDPHGTFDEFQDREVRTSWLSGVARFRRDPRQALPFLASAWSNTIIRDADIVLCSSTGWAHGVRTTAPKIVYCHNPARWLYQSGEYLADANVGARMGLRAVSPRLRRWDRQAARSASTYLANSSVVAERIERTYGIKADIVHPPAGDMSEGDVEPIDGIAPGFLLTIGRARGYKNTDAVADAVALLPGERLVAVGGLPAGSWPDRVVGLTNVSDAQLRWLYQNADALVACAFEDFGLTPIEAYASGTPAIVLRAGGYLDTTIPGVTGEFINAPVAADIADAIARFRLQSYSSDRIRAHAEFFSFDRFAERLHEIVDGYGWSSGRGRVIRTGGGPPGAVSPR